MLGGVWILEDGRTAQAAFRVSTMLDQPAGPASGSSQWEQWTDDGTCTSDTGEPDWRQHGREHELGRFPRTMGRAGALAWVKDQMEERADGFVLVQPGCPRRAAAAASKLSGRRRHTRAGPVLRARLTGY